MSYRRDYEYEERDTTEYVETRRGGYEREYVEETRDVYQDDYARDRRGGYENEYVEERDVVVREEYAPRKREGFAEEVAEWAGEKVGRAEYDYDRAKYDVETLPERAAGWAGREVGRAERFKDEVEDSYEEGKYEGRRGW